jgi:hypothetical protein
VIIANKVGDALAESGDADQALDIYKQGWTIAKTLADRNTSDPELRRDLLISNMRVGDALAQQAGDKKRSPADRLALAEQARTSYLLAQDDLRSMDAAGMLAPADRVAFDELAQSLRSCDRAIAEVGVPSTMP